MVRLTDLSIKTLPIPEKGQKTYWDSTLKGFGFRLSRGGAKTFVLQHGKRRQLTTIGRYPLISLSDARSAAKKLLADITLGKHLPRAVAFDFALTEYLAEAKQSVRPSTFKSYSRHLNSHYPFKGVKLTDITAEDIQRKLSKLSRGEALHAYTAGRIFFRFCMKKHYLERNPFDRLSPPSKPVHKTRVLTNEELKLVYNAQGTFGLILKLLILTGQRRTEISSLKWEWINEKDRLITLPETITKNKRPHTFPYGDMVQQILDTLHKQQEYLFPATRMMTKDTTTFNSFGKSKQQLDEAINIPDWTIHDLRRTFASNLAALNVPIHITEKLLNHVSGTFSGVVGVYNQHLYIEEMRDAITTYEKHLRIILSR